ncbi:MAG: glycosyltransferase [candidate division Zixibacteria bacterium]|nr:glycosyltransferase [candidate division Zixibacteria bacterium]
MNIFTAILAILTVIYAASIIYLLVGLYRRHEPSNEKKQFLSVIVSAHNEEDKILECLRSIDMQEYPRQNYEVIVVDDRSTDNTYTLAEKFCEGRANFHAFRLRDNQPAIPKKTALLKGFDNSNGEIIVTTDADCVLPSRWLAGINSYFAEEVGMVIGHTNYRTNDTLFSGVDALDYLSQRSMGVAFANHGSAYTCTSSNLAYRREIFAKARNEFAELKIRPADDNFLLNYVHRKTGYKIVSAVDSDSIGETGGAKNIGHFLNQRFRWGSYGDKPSLGMTMFFIPALLYYIALWLGLVLLPFLPGIILPLAFSIGVKLLVDFAYMNKSALIFNCAYLMKFFIPAWLLNFILVPVIVIRGNLFPFEWKGKRYTRTAEVEAS